jgi:hypothetical protein
VKTLIATISCDADAPQDCEMSVEVSEVAIGFLSTLTDLELKVFAAEAGLRIQRALGDRAWPTDWLGHWMKAFEQGRQFERDLTSTGH